MIKDYILHLIKSNNEHSLHSPFLFDFYTKVIKDKSKGSDYQVISGLRKHLLGSQEIIEIVDFGAGSKINPTNKRKVAEIVKNAEKPLKFGNLFKKIINYFQFENTIDLGTSLGLTTAFLGFSGIQNKIITFEGCPNTAKIAQQNFDKLKLQNIEIIVGNIDETLEKEVEKIEKIDFVFFDANHRYEPTIRYFETCLPKIHENSCFVFDDIYWSVEMKAAWKTIKNHPKVMISIDLFWIGIVFFRTNQPKQHFILRF